MIEQQGMALKEIFILDVRVKFFIHGDEALEQVVQRRCGCPLLESVQGQIGWAHWVSNLIWWLAFLSVVGGGCS